MYIVLNAYELIGVYNLHRNRFQNGKSYSHRLRAVFLFINKHDFYDKYENNLDNCFVLWYNIQIGEGELLCIHMANILKVVYHSEI